MKDHKIFFNAVSVENGIKALDTYYIPLENGEYIEALVDEDHKVFGFVANSSVITRMEEEYTECRFENTEDKIDER